jgi:GNAT superfamily N-acetyltransferase
LSVECVIREATAGDAKVLLGLIDALADYEHLPRPDAAARVRLAGHGFGTTQPYFRALLAERAGRPVGYAIWFLTYSTFVARPTLYLEDIFVLPEERGGGVGEALMRRLAGLALEQGCGRMEWQVLDWNKLARGFYQRLGARRLEEWLPYRLTEDEIALLADQEGEGGA